MADSQLKREDPPLDIPCEYCPEHPPRRAWRWGASTAYHWRPPTPTRFSLIEVDATPEELALWQMKYDQDPNRDLFMCEVCAEDYYSFWDEQWREYYSGLL